MGTVQKVDEFFGRYAAALLARDAKAIGGMYAVPGLILFPRKSIAVGDRAETEAFFDSAWDQYEGVTELDWHVEVVAEGPAGVWADVTWSWGEEPRERFMYQLVEGSEGYEVAVLTPLPIED